MAKTLVQAAHKGQHENGVSGCFTRWAHEGVCAGVQQAEWLNSLGEDEDHYGTRPFTNSKGEVITNLFVRQNWLRSSEHIQRVK